MTKEKFLINLIIENLHLRCRYYQVNKDQCLKYGDDGYKEDGSSHSTYKL